ncbi:MAG: hypothetical protein ACREJO_13250 [Phycisphaerales bacterium]
MGRTIILALAAVAFAMPAAVAPAFPPPAPPPVSRDINSYVLFAYDELVWKGGTPATDSGRIYGGNIGVNYADRSPTGFALSFGTSARGIMSPGSQAVAHNVRADDAADIFYYLYANAVNASFGATVNNPNPDTVGYPDGNIPFTGPIIDTPNLPVLPFTPNRALTNGAADLTVNGSGGLPSPQTLSPGAYRDMRFNDNAVVNFLAGTYDIRNLSMGMNVTINVTDATILQIDRNFDPNNNLTFGANPGHNGGARILVGGFGNNVNTTRTTNFSQNAEIHAQYFAPTAWLDLGGNNELFGRFWAQRITGDPNNNVTFVVPSPAAAALLTLAGALAHRRRRVL